ncbi:phytanoyl-CoA dioxygenase family protein [Erythrobacter sp.]|jgi:ectoine hydroxylase-related dioxygenase (phytanoyl-CoA dioxygenase family)|uniref:phytanoyl-CoA dioxygenase family protein n=1 Tax=Erythrobacter sp. TaxID=1042 RepID=UPI002EB1DB53|nr:phytanoyl-CoA dioxygenase family protein [Erythrobacter sp.]
MASVMEATNANTLEQELAPYLGQRPLHEVFAEFDREGYVIFERVLGAAAVQRQIDALELWLGKDVRGRNNFEGADSNRIYAMLAKDPVFAELVAHRLQLAFGERELGRSMLLYACLAINLLPGETAQPWHFDDSHCGLARPRAPLSMSTFWSLTDTTEENGATEIIPGSHLWGDERPDGASGPEDFLTGKVDKIDGAGDTGQAIKATMPAGSLMIAKGTLWHRGGANRSHARRLIVTPQFSVGWARPLEQQLLAVPPEKAAKLPERVQGLLGYSIHEPFMGYVDGMHPKRVLKNLEAATVRRRLGSRC